MCLHLAREQQTRGQDVMIHFFEAGAASEMAKQMDLPLIVSESPPLSPRRQRWRYFAIELRATCERFQPDIVHSHVPLSNLICDRTLPKMKIPWVTTIHGSWRQFAYAPQTVRKPWLKPYLSVRHALGDLLITRSASHIAAISEYIKRELVSIGVSGRRIMTIHDGLPPNLHPLTVQEGRARLRLPQDAPIIGSLGFFAPVKGFDLLIRAFSQLAARHPKLLLVIAGGDVLGNTAYRENLTCLIDQLGVGDRVRLLGSVNPKAGFLAALNIFVVASRTEGFSLSLVEAMQHGKPSVVSSAGGSIEAARPNREALVFKSGSVVELAETVEKLLMDQKLRESLGESARERARAYLTIERCATEYDDFYESALSAAC